MKDVEKQVPSFVLNGINLASPRLGAKVVSATDDFFADKSRLIKVEEPIFIDDKYDEHGKWMDGWESRRRRMPGNDHCIIQLGTKGTINGVDINTRFFTGNHPPKASVDVACIKDTPNKNTDWTEILPISDLGPDRHNFFSISSPVAANWMS